MKKFVYKQYKNKRTQKVYKKQAERFCRYIKEAGYAANDVRKNPQPVLQEYANYLAEKGLSADTIHTYLSLPCVYFDISMRDVKKPKRMAVNIKRSRDNNVNVQGETQENHKRFARLVAFQRCVGVRRAELAKLTGENFKQDENGSWCVEVKRGKGGKYQLQRILPQDVTFIKSYFDGSKNAVFTAEEMNNKIDLHAMRSAQARKAYDYYLQFCENPIQRAHLQQELRDRFALYNKKYIYKGYTPALLIKFEDDMEGEYRLRGSTAGLAKSNSRPLSYDKTALMAVSVFHLSHWRCDVTVRNYLLA